MRKYLIFSIIIFLFLNCNVTHDSIAKFKKELLTVNEANLKEFLKNYNINKYDDFKIKDYNYYYIFAKLFYDKTAYSKWTLYLLNKAIEYDNIFRNDAINFYLKYLIENENYEKLIKFVNNNLELLKSDEYKIFIIFAANKTISDLDYINTEKSYLPVLMKIIKNNPDLLKENRNINKLHDYILETKLYDDKDKETLDFLKYIKRMSKDNFISLTYFYRTKNRKQFLTSLEAYINNPKNINETKAYLLQFFSIRLGYRKNFYNYLSKNYTKNKYLKYYYATELMYYISYKKGLNIYKEILDLFKENSLINYNIRYHLLNSTRSLTKNWINKAFIFYNDYPDYYKSKLLFDYIVRYAIIENKGSIVTSIANDFTFDSMDPLYKSIFYYNLYLMDKKSSKKWEKILLNDFPLSYGALSINNGKLPIKITENEYNLPDEKLLSLNGKILYDKVKYLLEFDYYEDVVNLDLNNIIDLDKLFIYEALYKHSIEKKNYFDALKYTKVIISLKYNGNQYKINNLELLKRLYPDHFKEYVFKYSDIYKIDPAFVYGVMREESHFKYDIVSYMNAIGLMQIIPSTGNFIAKKLNIKEYNLNNPEDNIKMGIYYLKFLERYFTEKELILSCYNAGQGRTKRWHRYYKKYPKNIMYELIPVYETRHYIRKVMLSYYIYNFLIENNS